MFLGSLPFSSPRLIFVSRAISAFLITPLGNILLHNRIFLSIVLQETVCKVIKLIVTYVYLT